MKTTILLVLLISIIYVSASPSLHFKDSTNWQKHLSSLEISKGLVSGSLKDTHQALSSLEILGGEFTPKQTSEFCSNVRQTLEKKSDIESIYHATSIAKILTCTLSQVKVESTIKQILEDESSVEELFYAVSSGNNLKELDQYEFNESVLEVISLIDSYGEVDGTVANRKSDSGTLFHSGLAFEILAIIKSHVDLGEDEEGVVSAFAENAASLLHEKLIKTSHGSVFYDRGDSRGALKVSSALINGAHALFLAANDGDNEIKLQTIEALGEYIVSHTPELTNLEDIFYFTQLIKLFSSKSSTLPKPLVLSLTQTSLESSKGGDSSIKVQITDVLGNPVPELIVFLLRAVSSNQKVLANNIKLFPVKGSKVEYEFNLPTLKSEQGLYSLEFGAQTVDKKVAITQTTRSIKVLSSVTVGTVDLSVIDSGDKKSVQTYTATDSRPFGQVKTSYFYTLLFSFQVKNQLSSKQIFVEQAFIRLAGSKSSITIPAKYSEINYKAEINLKNYAKDLEYHTGDYTAELIVGDSFVINPQVISLGTVRIEFPKNTDKLKEKEKESVYTQKKEIDHKFRAPEPRPAESVSFAFTLATLAPFLILLFSLGVIGANIRIPTGISFITTLVFAAGIILIFTLYGWFWYELNMFQTLGYLGVLGLITILSGNLSLSARHAQRNKVKAE